MQTHDPNQKSSQKAPNASAPTPQPVTGFQQLQSVIGNRAISRMIQNKPDHHPPHAPAANAIQRFDSPEHVDLGDSAAGPGAGFMIINAHRRNLPNHADAITTWPEAWQRLYNDGNAQQKRMLQQGLSYGEIIALSGDFYEDWNRLNNASLREVYTLLPLIRDGATTSQLEAATGGRYLALAARNETHFSHASSGHSNMETWRQMHIQALTAAVAGGGDTAYAMNAAADHFLTDAFSSGHMRVQRDQLMTSTSGNIQSKIQHDLDNQHGVDVSNPRGDTWTAYGDETFDLPATDPRHAMVQRNRVLGIEAVRLSRQDVTDAIAQGTRYTIPSTFAAEQIVPVPVDPSASRWGALDYAETAAEVAGNELPGIVTGAFTDDDAVREWAANTDAATIGRQPTSELIRMINVLMGGWISDDDVDAMEKICQGASAGGKMQAIRAEFEPRATEFSSIGQRTRFRVILRQYP
ncbi:MAG: hypothetical protein IAE89_04945 [Anaerolineae bacterium]|nr:hypothetical protein [Anaerolineae bacterium]